MSSALTVSGKASPAFGQANANFSVFIDCISNQLLKKMNNDDLNLHLHEQIVRLASLLLTVFQIIAFQITQILQTVLIQQCIV